MSDVPSHVVVEKGVLLIPPKIKVGIVCWRGDEYTQQPEATRFVYETRKIETFDRLQSKDWTFLYTKIS